AGRRFVAAGLSGVGTLKGLALVLYVGLASGACSSIFIATPVTADLKEREQRYAALRKRVLAKRAAAPAKAKAGGAAAEPVGADAATDGGGGAGEADRPAAKAEPVVAVARSTPRPAARPPAR